FTSVDADGRGLTIANRGLPEASVPDDGTGSIALTVLRAVGYLSRGDLLSRIEGAGPLMPTPEAQMLGPILAEYSIIPHAGSWAEASAHRVAHAFNAGLAAVELPGLRPVSDPGRRRRREGSDSLPPAASLLEVDGPVEVTAIKGAEEHDGLVVRVLNQGARPAHARLRPFRAPSSVRGLSLAEEPIDQEPMSLVDGWAEVDVEPWQLVTIGFQFG
ncbi:MAG: glycosyl hydrolase-related protein, partial [Candidatus Limnocylindria bacterium]